MRPRRTPTLRQISSRSSSVTPYPCFSYTIYRIKPSLLRALTAFIVSRLIVRLVYGEGHRPDHNPKDAALGLKSSTSLVLLRWGISESPSKCSVPLRRFEAKRWRLL